MTYKNPIISINSFVPREKKKEKREGKKERIKELSKRRDPYLLFIRPPH